MGERATSPGWEWGARRTATFSPKRTDTLRPEALARVGETLEWEYAGMMDEGPYDGQAIWTPTDRSLPWFGWVPEEDLDPPASDDKGTA